MASNLASLYRTKETVTLVTVRVGGVSIRLCWPEGATGPRDIVDADGATRRYFGGLLDVPVVTHSFITPAGSADLAFHPPRHLRAKPHLMDWSTAEAEIAHWWEGETWEGRRVLLSDALVNVEYEDSERIVTATVQSQDRDSGRMLTADARVSEDLWADVGKERASSGTTTAYDPDSRNRALDSSGVYYGEIIGYPKWVECLIVQDDIDAVRGTTTDYTPFKAIVCEGYLQDDGARAGQVLASDRGKPWFKSTVTPYTGTDGAGNLYTAIDVDFHAITTAAALYHPASIGSALWVANMDLAGNYVQTLDKIRQTGDGDHFYRTIISVESGSEDDSSYYGVLELDGEYGGLAAEDASTSKVVPIPASGRSIWLACDSAGGAPKHTNEGEVLTAAPDVIAHYLRRSVGIKVNYASVYGLPLYDYEFDGVVRDGDASPIEWLRENIYPLLPVAEAWTGEGYSLFEINPTDDRVAGSVEIGVSGRDGERLSGLIREPASVVVNDVTVLYAWIAPQENYRGYVYTAPEGWEGGGSLAIAWQVVGQALSSQTVYGRRNATVEAFYVARADTARRIHNQIVARKHKPRWRMVARLKRRWAFLDINAILEVTDPDVGLQAARARVIEVTYPPEGVTVLLEEMG